MLWLVVLIFRYFIITRTCALLFYKKRLLVFFSKKKNIKKIYILFSFKIGLKLKKSICFIIYNLEFS